MLFRPLTVLLLLLPLLASLPVGADEDDTRILLEQGRRAAERRAVPPDEPTLPPGTVLFEGTIYTVGTSLEELEPAIYITINSGQWERLQAFVSRYRLLEGSRPALVAMAEGLEARHRGDLAQALRRMRAAHDAEPEDVRIRLELARLFLENNQDSSARKEFARIETYPLPETVQALIDQYQQVLNERNRWHGSLAFGLGHSDNINQANGHYSCLEAFAGLCLIERRMPEKIPSGMINYELAMGRRIHLDGQHNLLLRPVVYGNRYRDEAAAEQSPIKDYSSNTAILYLGYNWLDARDSFSVSPYVEHYYRDGHTQYLAGGLQIEWRHTLNPRWQIGSTLDAKRYEHSSRGLRTAVDYSQYQWGISASYAAQVNTVLHAGLDLVRKKYPVPSASGKEVALRTGIYHAVPGEAGLYVNATAIIRVGRNDAFDGFLGERRNDRQQIYIASFGASAWKFAGLTPELRLKHTIQESNPDWAFGFRQAEVSLLLRHDF